MILFPPHFHYHSKRLSSQVQVDYLGKTTLKPFAVLRRPIVAGKELEVFVRNKQMLNGFRRLLTEDAFFYWNSLVFESSEERHGR